MAIGQWADDYLNGGKPAGGGGKLYELTQDATQAYVLHATYNEMMDDLSTGYPLALMRTDEERGGATILSFELYALVVLVGVPGQGYQCMLKEIASNETVQDPKTLEMTAYTADDYFVSASD